LSIQEAELSKLLSGRGDAAHRPNPKIKQSGKTKNCRGDAPKTKNSRGDAPKTKTVGAMRRIAPTVFCSP